MPEQDVDKVFENKYFQYLLGNAVGDQVRLLVFKPFRQIAAVLALFGLTTGGLVGILITNGNANCRVSMANLRRLKKLSRT